MELYLATGSAGHGGEKTWEGLNVLESYWYARRDSKFAKYLPTAQNFLMDSGAFTFMEANSRLDWDSYTDSYIDFINQYDIKLFFEMDIDLVAGLDVAEKLRERIERGTGKKPIPVWHINRGKQYFVDMCKEYPYVAFGGLLSDGKSRQTLEKTFPWFIHTAHSYGAKIHLLGYSSIEGLKKYRPDSADSSSWTTGSRYANATIFNPRQGNMEYRHITQKGKRLKASTFLLEKGWQEWVKCQQYLRKYY